MGIILVGGQKVSKSEQKCPVKDELGECMRACMLLKHTVEGAYPD